ncbi:MAG TPA: GAF domain-containing SpoIIE family protein phosphatase [Streptosporangiaceae bacterium]
MTDWLESRLRDIQSITDAEMSRLGDQDFLTELLGRVKAVLQVDTAAILLLDARHEQLTATAAAGLEEEVRQGVRIPVGQGFAGRIAATGKPVVLERVDHTTVLNPILLDKGIHSLLGVPLVAGKTMLGVLHVGSLTARRFTPQDIELLQLAADRAATVVRSILARDDQIAVAALQRSLIPSALPMAPGVELAGRYIPGHGVVGGDWYDAFHLPSGELGLVIGDVAGSGLAAAVVMGRIRSALRAYALETLDPAEVLARLDRKMQHFEPGAMATVLYVIIDPDLNQAHMASAGHLPPVLASPARPTALAEIPPNLMIGVAPGARRQVTTVDITPGTVLCLYTDGLIERRGELIDDGLALLCQAVSAQPADAGCAAVTAALVGNEPVRDDTALLMFRRLPHALSAAAGTGSPASQRILH